MQRIYAIHEAVKQGSYPNCRILAERLDVTDKTIQRDISFMRDELELPRTTMSSYMVIPIHGMSVSFRCLIWGWRN